MIIIDMGSGNTSGNSWPEAKRMIDALAEIDKERKCVIKWQLFERARENIPLDKSIFSMAYLYADDLGFKTTASVFDRDSLNFLLGFEIPFVKIANRRDLDWLIGEIPRKINVIMSMGRAGEYPIEYKDVSVLACISKYPAVPEDYENFHPVFLKKGISDHTIGLDLYKKYHPQIWEKHFCLRDQNGLDCGPFAIRPEELKEIL